MSFKTMGLLVGFAFVVGFAAVSVSRHDGGGGGGKVPRVLAVTPGL